LSASIAFQSRRKASSCTRFRRPPCTAGLAAHLGDYVVKMAIAATRELRAA
jgi:hypothetical protein